MHHVTLFVMGFVGAKHLKITTVHRPKKAFVQSSGRGFKMKEDAFSSGWISPKKEFDASFELMNVTGVPTWLRGTLLRNGPALFETSNERMTHQFDGFTKINKLKFEGKERVLFQSKFLRTKFYNYTDKYRKLPPFIPFSKLTPNQSYLRRLQGLFNSAMMDNNNINIHKTWDDLYVTSESSQSTKIDIDTLNVIGSLNENLEKDTNEFMSSAHPQNVINSSDTFNWLYNPVSRYLRLYRDSNATRRFIGKFKIDSSPLMHSFAVSKEFVVLFHYPLRVNIASIIMGHSVCFVDSLEWASNEPTLVYIMNATSTNPNARPLAMHSFPSFYCMHTINAFQQKDKLFVDLIAYDSPEFLSNHDTFGELNLMRSMELRSQSSADDIQGNHRRLVFDMEKKPKKKKRRKVQEKNGRRIANCNTSIFYSKKMTSKFNNERAYMYSYKNQTYIFEMPCMNKFYRGRAYRYVYGVGNREKFTKWSVVKHNVNTGEQWVYDAPLNDFTGEPIFVPHPNSTAEDDGVLLNLILNGTKRKSYMLLLNASTMQPITSFELPLRVPFDTHGLWIP